MQIHSFFTKKLPLDLLFVCMTAKNAAIRIFSRTAASHYTLSYVLSYPCLCLDSCFSLSLGLCLESCFLLLYHRIRIVRKIDTDHRFFSGRCTVHFHINMITFVMYFICPIVSRIETSTSYNSFPSLSIAPKSGP